MPGGPPPYTSYWTDTKEQVIAYALQVMLAVMNYGFFQVPPNAQCSPIFMLPPSNDMSDSNFFVPPPFFG